jgi:hypothetical protein
LYKFTLTCLEILENYFISFTKCRDSRKIVYLFYFILFRKSSCLENLENVEN